MTDRKVVLRLRPVGHLVLCSRRPSSFLNPVKKILIFLNHTPLSFAVSAEMDDWRMEMESDSKYTESVEEMLMSLLGETHLTPGSTGSDSGISKKQSEGDANPYEYLLDSQYDDVSEEEASEVEQGCELDLLGDLPSKGSPSNRLHPSTPDRSPFEFLNPVVQVEERGKVNNFTQPSDLRENGFLHPGSNLWGTDPQHPGPHYPGVITTEIQSHHGNISKPSQRVARKEMGSTPPFQEHREVVSCQVEEPSVISSASSDLMQDRPPQGTEPRAQANTRRTSADQIIWQVGLELRDEGDAPWKNEEWSGEVGASDIVAPRPLGKYNTPPSIVVGASTERETTVGDRSPSPVRAPVPEVRVNLVALTSQQVKKAEAPITTVEKTPGSTISHRRTRWLSTETERVLRAATHKGHCLECGLVRSRQRIRQHVVQHFMRAYCPCGFQSASRDSVYSHQQARYGDRDHGGPEGNIYVADEETYPAMARHLQWAKVPPFMGCTPVLTPPESRPVGQANPARASETRPARKAPAKMQSLRQASVGADTDVQGIHYP